MKTVLFLHHTDGELIKLELIRETINNLFNFKVHPIPALPQEITDIIIIAPRPHYNGMVPYSFDFKPSFSFSQGIFFLSSNAYHVNKQLFLSSSFKHLPK